MVKPRTTAYIHNASATMYKSVNRSESSVTSSRPRLLPGLFARQNDNPASSSVGVEWMQPVNETQDSVMDKTQNNSVDNSSDGRSYLLIHQSREKWENMFSFLFFSEAKNSWLCRVCSEYSKGDEFWRTKGLSKRTTKKEFSSHTKNPRSKNKRHKTSNAPQRECL